MKEKAKSILSQIKSKQGNKLGAFWNTVITLIIVYALIKWGIPLVSRKITGLPFPLSVPGTLMLFYMALVIFAPLHLHLLLRRKNKGISRFQSKNCSSANMAQRRGQQF